MRLILIRHAEREHLPLIPDNAQVLTPTGQHAAHALGKYLARLKLPPTTPIFSSDYARALQTAQLLNQNLTQPLAIQTLTCLRPENSDSISQILELMQVHSHNLYLLLVGHQPELEQLGLHLTGRPLPLKKAEAVCLEIKDTNNWSGKVEWKHHAR